VMRPTGYLHVTVAARFAIHNYLPPHPVQTPAKQGEFIGDSKGLGWNEL